MSAEQEYWCPDCNHVWSDLEYGSGCPRCKLIHNDVFNPKETDLEYFLRRVKEKGLNNIHEK